MTDFVHLHTYSDYSLLKGMSPISQLTQKVAEETMPALALTDFGNLYGAMEFYTSVEKINQSIKTPIKPILGCEILINTNHAFFPLLLLVKNLKGYKNLIKLISTACLKKKSTDPFPSIKKKVLENYKEGLIALSAGLEGEIACLILQNKSPEKVIDFYASLFGKDHFFLEIQNHQNKDELRIREKLSQLSKTMKLPLVATNEVRYLNKEDASAHEILLRIQSKETIFETEKNGKITQFSTPGTGYHFKTYEEMLVNFPDQKEALKNTVKIAEMCHLTFPKTKIHYPLFTVPKKKSEFEFLKEECLKRLKEKKQTLSETYLNRLEYELDIIKRMGFSSYFLITADFINFAKKKGILVGPGRGSAAGSLVVYAMGITSIDPIENGLLFERFLNPERITLPDIDIDFQDNRREEIIEYCKKKYGTNRIAQIITYGKLKARAVFKDISRVFKIDFNKANQISSLITQGKTLKTTYEENDAFKDTIIGNILLQNVYRYALKLEGLTRHTGVHAAGVIISDRSIDSYVPLTKDEEGNILTQYEGGLLEEKCGLIKMDFLGLKTLSILQECITLIKQTKKETIDLESISLKDLKTYSLLSKGNSLGVFQFESSGMRQCLKELKPNCLEDLTTMNAMYRPGPMSWISIYIAKKHHKKPRFEDPKLKSDFEKHEKLLKKYPVLEEILKTTNGIPIYQEQIMEIGKNYAGLSFGKADLMRRAMGKKKIKELAKIEKEFIKGAENKGYQGKDSKFLFEKIIMPFAGYGFNKSHAVCYAYIAYQTAYLKANYTAEFMTSLLNSECDNTDKIKFYLDEATLLKIKVLPPDINNSSINFKVIPPHITYALRAIKGVGKNVSLQIIENRKTKGTYTSFEDFLRKNNNNLNKQVVENLIKVGSFLSLGVKIQTLLEAYPLITEKLNEEETMKRGGQVTLFDNKKLLDQTAHEDQFKKLLIPKADFIDNLKEYEKQALGFNLRHNEVIQHSKEMVTKTNIDFSNKTIWIDRKIVKALVFIENIRAIKTKKNSDMAFVTIKHPTGVSDAIIFPTQYKKIKDQKTKTKNLVLQKGILVYIIGIIQNNTKGQSIIIEKIKEFIPEKKNHHLNSEPKQPKIMPSILNTLSIKFSNNQATKEELLDLKSTLKKQAGKKCKIVLLFNNGQKDIKVETNDVLVDYSEKLIENLYKKNFVQKAWFH